MKRMAFVLAIIAMAGCKKTEPPATSTSVPDTSSKMMMADTSKMMMADTSKTMMAAPKK